MEYNLNNALRIVTLDICLVLKKLQANKSMNIRPISLVTSLYKILDNVLAERLKKFLLLMLLKRHSWKEDRV